MSKTQLKEKSGENTSPRFSLPLVVSVRDNTATTKLLAVMPNRQSLAFFVPKICEPTTPKFPTGAKQRHILDTSKNGFIPSYGGLIRPNTIAFMVNKSSRLVTVVETRHPLFECGIQTTNLLGGHTHA